MLSLYVEDGLGDVTHDNMLKSLHHWIKYCSSIGLCVCPTVASLEDRYRHILAVTAKDIEYRSISGPLNKTEEN